MTVLTSSGFDTTELQLGDKRGRLNTRRLDEIRPHPEYIRHGLAVHARQLAAIAKLGDLVFCEPLLVTHEGVILDGYARWKLAGLRSRATVACIEYEMSEPEALRYLIQRHSRSSGLNDFNRICLSLGLEPFLAAKSRANQQAGGRNKGSSNLTEAGRLDVRREIARIAGVSVGNVTKVKQLMITAHPDVIQALREKELSIHRAWLLSRLSPEEQRKKLWQNRSKKGLRRTIRRLISSHVPTSPPLGMESIGFTNFVAALQSGQLGSIPVVSIRVPGRSIFITEEVFRDLQAPEGSHLECATDTR